MSTASPARYAEQLLSHFGRRVLCITDGDASTAGFTVAPGDSVLSLLGETPMPRRCPACSTRFGRHLERFGQRNELTVICISDATSGGPTPLTSEGHRRPPPDESPPSQHRVITVDHLTV